MSNEGDKTTGRVHPEPEIIPPDRKGSGGFQQRGSGYDGGRIFIDLRGGEQSFATMLGISRFKLALWATLFIAIALALVLTFASLFVIAAVVSACVAAVAVAVAWVKRFLR